MSAINRVQVLDHERSLAIACAKDFIQGSPNGEYVDNEVFIQLLHNSGPAKRDALWAIFEDYIEWKGAAH